MAVGGRLGPTALWNVQDVRAPTLVAVRKVPSWSLAFSQDDRLLVAGGGEWRRGGDQNNGRVTLLEANSLEVKASTEDPPCLVTSVIFLPGAPTLAAADYTGTIAFYDYRLRKLGVLKAHDEAIRSLALSAPAKSAAVLASAGLDGEVKLWHVATRTHLGSISNKVAVYSLSFADDGQTLAGGRADGTAKLWRTQGEDRVFFSE